MVDVAGDAYDAPITDGPAIEQESTGGEWDVEGAGEVEGSGLSDESEAEEDRPVKHARMDTAEE